MITNKDYEDIFKQQKTKLQLNLEMAIKINQNLIRDESKINLEFNEEDGCTTFKGFSFIGDSNEEYEVKR